MNEMREMLIGLDRIRPGRFQPRDRARITDESVAELAADIKQRGLINPLIVVGVEGSDPIEVELLAGERRWRACRLAGLTTVPVRLVQGDDSELEELAFVDNLLREDLTPIEEAKELARLQALHQYSQRELARRVSQSQGWVQQRLALVKAPAAVQEMVNTRVIGIAEARALGGLPDAVQAEVAKSLSDQADVGVGVTSRQVENLATRIKQFLDPARLQDLEGRRMDPELRNAMCALRWLMENAPAERIAAAVARLVEAKPGSDEARLMGKGSWGHTEVASLIYLLQDPNTWQRVGWRGLRPEEWPDLAVKTGRTCARCMFAVRRKPEPCGSYGKDWCARWKGEKVAPVSCLNCVTVNDHTAIRVKNWWFHDVKPSPIEEVDGESWIGTVDDFLKALTLQGEAESRRGAEDRERKENGYASRLNEYRDRCTAALDQEDGMLDVTHFQAQWCERCALCGPEGCTLIQNPVGREYELKPGLLAWIQLEQERDSEDKPVVTATRVVPRCELFRYGTLPVLSPVGWVKFSQYKDERRDTVIRWLDAMLNWDRYTAGDGIWSPLRWLPYGRSHGQHFEKRKLADYIMKAWDQGDLNDNLVGTLLNAAASEAAAIRGGHKVAGHTVITVWNPVLKVDEDWLPTQLSYIPPDGSRPNYLGNSILWRGGE